MPLQWGLSSCMPRNKCPDLDAPNDRLSLQGSPDPPDPGNLELDLDFWEPCLHIPCDPFPGSFCFSFYSLGSEMPLLPYPFGSLFPFFCAIEQSVKGGSKYLYLAPLK